MGGFSELRMHSVLEEMWNKVEYDLKDPKKNSGQLEECSYSKGVQSGFNGRTYRIYEDRKSVVDPIC